MKCHAVYRAVQFSLESRFGVVMGKYFAAGLGFFLAVGALAQPDTSRPSFDCAKASTRVEKMICGGSGYLKRADAALSSSYRDGLKAASDKEAFRRRQQESLQERDRCSSEDCLMAWYERRLSELDSKSSPSAVSSGQSSAQGTMGIVGSWACSNGSQYYYGGNGTFVEFSDKLERRVLFAGKYEVAREAGLLRVDMQLIKYLVRPGESSAPSGWTRLPALGPMTIKFSQPSSTQFSTVDGGGVNVTCNLRPNGSDPATEAWSSLNK